MNSYLSKKDDDCFETIFDEDEDCIDVATSNNALYVDNDGNIEVDTDEKADGSFDYDEIDEENVSSDENDSDDEAFDSTILIDDDADNLDKLLNRISKHY